VSRSHEDGQDECGDGGQDRDEAWMPPEHLLGNLYHPVHAARCLQDTRTGDGCHDDIDDIGGGCAGAKAMVKDQDGQTETGNGSEGQTSVPGPKIEGQKYYQ